MEACCSLSRVQDGLRLCITAACPCASVGYVGNLPSHPRSRGRPYDLSSRKTHTSHVPSLLKESHGGRKFTTANLKSQRPGRRRHSLRGQASAKAASTDMSDRWLEKLPEKTKPLYMHSLPCIEAWLRSLEFKQSRSVPEQWRVERSDWHAELNMDITDLSIRYLKSGPGNLQRDVERKFSYALSRQDLENAILGGP